MPVPSYYDVLQVARDAAPHDIRSQYRRMAQRYHPDRSPNRYASRVMANLNKAYDVLSDPDRRGEHDQWLAAREADGGKRLRRLGRPAPLPGLESDHARWPWVLLFATISVALAAVATVVYKTRQPGQGGMSASSTQAAPAAPGSIAGAAGAAAAPRMQAQASTPRIAR